MNNLCLPLGMTSGMAVEFASFNAAHKIEKLPMTDVDWMARIIWASQ
jgi:phage repressor protein C with HTH and peptisase S24 domain